jgi:hypothetical protein
MTDIVLRVVICLVIGLGAFWLCSAGLPKRPGKGTQQPSAKPEDGDPDDLRPAA